VASGGGERERYQKPFTADDRDEKKLVVGKGYENLIPRRIGVECAGKGRLRWFICQIRNRKKGNGELANCHQRESKGREHAEGQSPSAKQRKRALGRVPAEKKSPGYH